MGTRYFALVLGIIYLLIGLMGLIPGVVTAAANPGVTVDVLNGTLLGIFPVNIIHTLVHLIIGIWGIIAYRSYSASRSFSMTVGVLFLVLFIMGLIPGLNTLFGLAPLYGADVWLHLITGIAGLYFGLTSRTPVDRTSTPVV